MDTLIIDFAIGATICAIAMFLANRFARDKNTSKAKFYIIFVGVILAMIAFKNLYVQSKYEEWRSITGIDNEIAKTEPYATLKATFPEDYSKIKDTLMHSLKAKETRQEAYLKGRSVLMGILMSKMKMASDEALTGFAQSFINTATYYYGRGQSDFAFDIIYNQKNLPRDWYKSMPKEFVEAEAANFKQILLSAAEKRIPIEDKSKTDKLIESIALELYSEHGDDVQLMQTPLSHPDKKAKIAKITIDFYSKILKLPDADRGMVLRQLLANWTILPE
jgi:hypothetical protein